MNFKRFLRYAFMAVLAVSATDAAASNIDADAARMAASNFLKQHAAATPSFRASALADVRLAHAESSKVDGNAYYVFNVEGGGWVIIAGDDRANQVLAYGDKGSIDMSNLPVNMKGYLDMYKNQIETIQASKVEIPSFRSNNRTQTVDVMLTTDWAQSNPYNQQCVINGQTCSVGCAGLAMAQILNYWEYPKETDGVPTYYNTKSFSWVPALPATTFNYDSIVDHYTVWYEGQLYLTRTTDNQKQELAKLCRYSAQACEMGFTPNGSGSDVLRQYKGFLKLDYSTEAKLVGIEAWPTRETWNTTDYTNEEWVELINAQLLAGHPIPYSSEGGQEGHAFVIDGLDANGLYHVNWGWWGLGDGWFQFGAFNVTILDEYLEYNDGLFMVIDLFPYEGYVSPNAPTSVELGDVTGNGEIAIDDVTALINFLLTGDDTGIDVVAADCNKNGEADIEDVALLLNYLLTGNW